MNKENEKHNQDSHKHAHEHLHEHEKEGENVVETKSETKIEDKKEEEKVSQKKQKVKKTEAIVNENNVHVSTKKSMAFCKFIKGKKIEKAIKDLEEVAVMKKPIPMKGEIPHRKGEIMAGRYHVETARHFIKILKRLSANANVNGLEDPVIFLAVANIGSRPFGRFGRIRRKRTNIMIVAHENMKNPKQEAKNKTGIKNSVKNVLKPEVKNI